MEELLKRLSQLLDEKGIHDPEMETLLGQLRQRDETAPAPFADNLIYVPMNPIVKEAQDLGGAEAVAFGYNVLGTAFINLFTNSILALSLAGPLIEKIGFFLREFGKAIAEHKKTGKAIGKGFKENISNGVKNLLVDIGIHDTIYTALMTYGISHQLFEPRILAVVSFLLALPPAIFIKYSGNELLYYLWKQLAKRQGFRRETYYESRFILNDLSNPTQLFQQIATRFKLHQHDISTYHDIYFTHHIPIFSERTNTVKSREIIDHATGTSFHNLEIVHFLPTKKTEKNSIFNYYYSKKEKGRKDISTTDREVVLKTFPFRPGIAVPSKQISFERKACFDKEIRITLDTIISSDTPKLTHVMEVKVYQDISALTEVMKYIIGKGHIHLTTYGKYDLM